MKTRPRNITLTVSLIVLAVASGAWAASLGEPTHVHGGPSDFVVIGGMVAALTIGFLLGTGIRGPWSGLIDLNRIIASVEDLQALAKQGLQDAPRGTSVKGEKENFTFLLFNGILFLDRLGCGKEGCNFHGPTRTHWHVTDIRF